MCHLYINSFDPCNEDNIAHMYHYHSCLEIGSLMHKTVKKCCQKQKYLGAEQGL